MQTGQKDTRWLIPLKVSRGYQGEEGNHTYQALQVFYGCGAIYFSGSAYSGRSVSPLTTAKFLWFRILAL
jgi:hypothetical protein